VPDRSKWRVVTLMHIAETREQAKKNVRFGLKAFADYFREIATFPIIPPDVPDDCDWLIETGTACIGTPDDAIAYIDKLLKGSGGFGVIMELAHNWADWDATRRHYELMARYVHSHFQKSFAPRVTAYAEAATQQKEFAKQAADAVQSEIDKQTARQAKTGT
jgi:limonene 1,2-monooxygenase